MRAEQEIKKKLEPHYRLHRRSKPSPRRKYHKSERHSVSLEVILEESDGEDEDSWKSQSKKANISKSSFEKKVIVNLKSLRELQSDLEIHSHDCRFPRLRQ